MGVNRVLTIAGSDSGGGAGIQADLKTITVLGGFGMSVITALTAQNTLGVQGVYEVPEDFVEKQFDSVATDIGIDAAKTGMLSNSRIIRTVAKKLRQYGINKLVVDPVMVAKGGAQLISNEAKKSLKEELLPLALVITPNIPEAEELAKIKISSVDDMKKAAEIIYGSGAKNVVIKGGHLAGDPVDILYDGKNFHEFTSERINTKNTHGTGCTFSAAIATKLAEGKSVFEAVKTAKEYTTIAIRFSLNIGGGHGSTNHMAHVLQESERYNCIQKLKSALKRLNAEKCGNIIPEVQSNLGYALPYACKAEDIAAIPGRIIRIGEETRTFGDLEFGASHHIASIILSTMKYNMDYRCAMNIRFSEDIINICMSLGFDVDNFDRSDEPDDTKSKEGYSLKWGIDSVLSKKNSIPDIIFDRGDLGKEPMIRVLGKNPSDVVDKVISISKELKTS
ncbi:MAG: bifunctional hydroxymethylpyrimidine kinase/phosphomethylpyrimidine kinase [Proteobacteria bacterium]|nr:bifunctional hydroxymethylpyrimidine kinase/phosphomethylpyrimidine kinase [Desulfobacteraceae bacterium]MBU3980533.1 bifunctional hydroxymethylpyrimidine kinase/phosphomethylpyrimidine kinase [Pseudomonadota bacterium]MBU4012060.1 bifunctional hydroxymethylpyrimidine kinase/phosphomethylpyrimidine kinase [Pseudomonadota bacterium]MBU4067261.1 bifunctional hydroxymethylpyrimidine kinase/phosphomethylpyrimidine kinase [Pseudomonadota bacterium]MBU4100072.1 bifunctional hydroxymethylpyrimidine